MLHDLRVPLLSLRGSQAILFSFSFANFLGFFHIFLAGKFSLISTGHADRRPESGRQRLGETRRPLARSAAARLPALRKAAPRAGSRLRRRRLALAASRPAHRPTTAAAWPQPTSSTILSWQKRPPPDRRDGRHPQARSVAAVPGVALVPMGGTGGVLSAVSSRGLGGLRKTPDRLPKLPKSRNKGVETHRVGGVACLA